MSLSKIRIIYGGDYLKPQEMNLHSNGEVNLYGKDLSFNGYKTQHATHAIHPYVAAINPPLVKALIDAYIPEGESILDPFCGGGGVLVESLLARRPCAGGEINPLGVIISRAKTAYIPEATVIDTGYEVLKVVNTLLPETKLTGDETLKFWFRESNLLDLLSLSKAIKLVVDGDKLLGPLFQTILSATARDVMLTYRGEVRLRRLQGKDLDKFHPDVLNAFLKRTLLTSGRVSQLPKDLTADIDNRDIRKLPFKNNDFYGIICSPPYADDKNGVGYFQFSKNMLLLLGFSKEQIAGSRDLFLGTIREGKQPPKSKSLNVSLENVYKNDKNKFAEAVAFYRDYADGLKEMARVVSKRIIIVIGNRVLSRTAFDNAAITVEIFKDLGVELEHHYTRELKKKRIPNLGGDGGGISLEHVLVFGK